MTVHVYRCDRCPWTYTTAMRLTADPVHPCPTPTSTKRNTARKVPQ